MAKDPILDLSTLTSGRPPIRVDGTIYHLKSSEELTLMESQNFTQWGHELETLGKAPEMVLELEVLVRKVAKATQVDMPDAVFEKLSTSQMMAIVEVFTALLLGKRLELAGALARQLSRPTGVNSSLASSTSTAAILAGGLTAPLAAS